MGDKKLEELKFNVFQNSLGIIKRDFENFGVGLVGGKNFESKRKRPRWMK